MGTDLGEASLPSLAGHSVLIGSDLCFVLLVRSVSGAARWVITALPHLQRREAVLVWCPRNAVSLDWGEGCGPMLKAAPFKCLPCPGRMMRLTEPAARCHFPNADSFVICDLWSVGDRHCEQTHLDCRMKPVHHPPRRDEDFRWPAKMPC